ncbi:hypothetical protein [Amycolatopsis palatopharyngis]|uniref:hypothetical protein n=1 Tax=Amycolatopsis palatopharyngis TaxID=187982 RepID=UPI0013BE8D94|nr:hypothetical protein [Amycolatopsis palatopharyngis]
MLTGRSAELLAALQQTFPTWKCTLDGDQVTLVYGRVTNAFRPPRRSPSLPEMLTTLTEACTAHGIQRHHPLPLRGLEDAELTFSAVQALDPYLKHTQHHVHAHGFLPQPVVRFTGERDEHGALLPGFATSFVNVSIVEPIATVREHATLIDAWIGVLSRLGFHAQHLTISGKLPVWHRAAVAGITLRIHHESRELGDAVLLWNRENPSKLATDIGSGLERMAWLLTQRDWDQVVYGTLAEHVSLRVLDAVRTATLIVGSGIDLAPRGPGNAIRRLLRREVTCQGSLGLSRIVRWAHAYWTGIAPLPMPWAEVCRILDSELLDYSATGAAWPH